VNGAEKTWKNTNAPIFGEKKKDTGKGITKSKLARIPSLTGDQAEVGGSLSCSAGWQRGGGGGGRGGGKKDSYSGCAKGGKNKNKKKDLLSSERTE